jgi:glycosyltransferase involved in cell wall biosynthesis
MNIQVLVAAMHQKDHQLLEKMNIQTDVIVGNQADHDSIEKFKYKNFNAAYLTFNERGVGLNRNNSLMRASADICMLADDDMVYVDGYPEIVKKAFEECPKADIIVFNLLEPHSTNKRYVIKKKQRVTYLNFLRYGAARVAFKLKSVRENGIYFNQCFGGGTEHCAGEDNLFLSSCLNKGLKIYAYPAYIAELTEERESTWNAGDVKKYLQDKGALFRVLSPKLWKLLCLQDAIRHSREYKMKKNEAFKLMLNHK